MLSGLKKVFLCGNYGDPTSARECLEILRYLREGNPQMEVGMHTNGGARTEEWWSDVGKLMKGKSYVRFAIDGLEGVCVCVCVSERERERE